jgi:transcriptional regulator with XRE-family HTH domain
MSLFGQRVKKLRENNEWSQRELAKRIGMSASVINRIELGDRPAKDEEIRILANIFNVSTDYLLGQTDTNSTHHEESLDPKLNIFFKEIKEESPERQEQLRKIWEIIKNEGK